MHAPNRCERQQKTSCVMETGSLTICLYAIFVFSAEGAPVFTEDPKNPFLAVEGDNVTLEWRYSLGKDVSLSQALFEKDTQILDKYSPFVKPWIKPSYRGRILVDITNNYTSIILLGVKRTDEGSYKLTVISREDRARNESKLEISILYLDQPNITSPDTRPVEGTDVSLSCFVDGKPTPTVSWTVNGSPLNTSRNSRVSLSNLNELLTIMSLDRTDSGEYQCVANNSLGNVSSNPSALRVQYPPAIALSPLNATKEEGEHFTWFCEASGNPEPNISWIFNGSHINTNYNPNIVFSKDKRKLTITNVSRKDSGEYQCLASNNIGNASSQVVTFDVLYIPEITAHPDNVTEKEGENVTLFCNAMGNPVPKISWNKGGSPLSNSSRVNLSADNKHLTLTNVKRVDSGEYRCVAANSLGYDTSNPAYLGVQFKPEISPLPRLIQRIEGEKLTIFCNATGNPLPTTSWTKDGNSVCTSYGSRVNLSYEGKQLIVKNVSKGDNGVYRCVAENSLGNVTSHGTTLEVHYIPGVTMIGGPQQFAIVGKIKKLLCEYDAMPPVSEVQWIKDGDVIARNSSLLVNESRISVPHYNESQIQLLISQSTSQDAGNYSCLVINAVGNSSQRTSVISQELPLITTRPEGKTPIEGEKITLSCNATGSPEPSISWVKDGSPIKSKSRIGLSKDNKRLTITNISRTDSGEYQCVARNRVGNDTSNSRVVVLSEPEVTIDGDQEQYLAKGSNIWLICRYEASPPVSEVQWIKEGTVIVRNTSVQINDSRVTIPSFNESQIQLSITAASLKDGGNYTCKVTNILGSTRDTTMIIIKDKPEIVTHPQNITTREGQNVTLYCNATGSPVPTISWYKNGYPINNSFSTIFSPSHEQLTIRNVNRIDSGDYTCQAKNRVGTDTSNASTINVQFRAEIVFHPQVNIIKEEGSNLTLFCNATGNPAPIISWTKDGSPTKNNSRIRFSKHNRLLTISNVNRTDSGHYRCVAKNSLGNNTSNVSAINIQYKPEITSHPKSVDIQEGGNVTFSCNYTANPSPTTSWTKDESPITNDSRISYSVVNKVLTITNVNRKDSGEYRCEASNKLGNDTSEAAELNVKYRPEITKHPQNVTVAERNNVTLTCNATGNPEPQFSWFKVENTVKSNNRINMSAKTSHLTITDVNRHDSGGYLCVAHNEVGNDTSIIVILDVQYKPEIATHPHNIRTREGQNVTIYCNATGNPVPTISWYKNEYPISNGFRIILSPGYEQLTIRNVNRIDSGNYTCRGNNSVGADTSDASTINVQFAPEISIHPRNVTIVRGDSVTFSCSVVGNPTPSVVWEKDRKDLNVTGNSRFNLSSRNNNLSLEIAEVHSSDSGQYRCVAENSKNISYSSAATLTVQYVPDPPEDVKVISRASREVNVSWMAGSNGNSAIQNYTVEIREDKQTFKDAICQGTLLKNNCVIYSTRVSIKELLPWTTYYLRVFARNMIGPGNYSSVVNVTTEEEVPSSAPPFNVTVLNSTAVNVSWQMLTKEDARGDILGYYILYKRKSEPEASWKNKTVDRAETTSSVLASLDEYTSYQFAIQAFNRKGVSGRSEIVERETDEVVPEPPQNIAVITKGSRAINISWTAGFDGNSAIGNYTVEISEHDQIFKDVICQGSLSSSACVVSSLSTTASLTGLFPWTIYNIRVFARNKIGRSNSSPILNVTTDEAEPSRGAENVSFSEVNYTTNRITWAELPKEAANGVIKLYEVRLELKESCLKVDFTFHAINTTKTSELLTGFWMCAKYEVSIRGYTVAGPGPYGKAIVVQTKSLKLSQTWSKETPSPPSFSQIPSGEGITANITLPRFPGNAKFFQVIVIRYSVDYTGLVNSPESFTSKDLMTYEEVHKSPVPAAYVTFQFRGQDFDVFRKFVVGDGRHSSSKPRNRRGSDGEVFLNKPLQPNTNYRVFLRAFIEKMVYFSSNFVTIEIKGEPAVKDLPERTIFQVGDVVVLTCEATGDPKPSVTWSKDGNTSIPRAQFRNDGHILVIQEVAPSDGGIYECRASNVFGQRRTATAVIIAVPPSIMKDVSPRSVLCAKETSCSLLCHATSDIPFNYSWRRNDQALDGHNIKVMNNSVIITPLDDQDFGDYVCHATNSFGSTTYKITLSESREEENNVQSIFRANDIIWSWIVFLLLVLIGVLIWRLRRAQASNRPATAKKATIRDTVQSVFPLEQHASEPASYMELRPRPSEGQTRVPPEYQSLQGSHVNAGYYNVVPEGGNKRGSNEEIYEEIELSDC
ncbi:hemicentin-1-like isoform X2 [Pocillopora verrucosa]|uniref:hemicentin-1-like isoform X2 n=1 Tax=Pocillopora verrucosa TaxID=203993 RepID=UPI003341BAF1